MQDRTFLLLAIRPNLNSLDKDLNTKEIETFQNDVLRPILKFQNDLLLQIFIDYVKQYKGVFFELSNHEKMSYIQEALSAHQRLRSLILGTIVGLFTVEDYSYYRLNLSELNKRIVALVIKRLQSQLAFLSNKF